MMSELEQVQPKAPPERPSALNMFTVSPRDRFLAAGTVIWCFLAVDTVLYAWPWGMGFTAAVWGWYVLLGAVVGRDLFRTWESRILLVVNLFLGASFALGSNPYFRGWNFLALLILGKTVWNRRSGFTVFSEKCSYQIYLLHLPILVAAAYHAAGRFHSVMAQVLAIWMGSLVLTVSACLLLKRIFAAAASRSRRV